MGFDVVASFTLMTNVLPETFELVKSLCHGRSERPVKRAV